MSLCLFRLEPRVPIHPGQSRSTPVDSILLSCFHSQLWVSKGGLARLVQGQGAGDVVDAAKVEGARAVAVRAEGAKGLKVGVKTLLVPINNRFSGENRAVV